MEEFIPPVGTYTVSGQEPVKTKPVVKSEEFIPPAGTYTVKSEKVGYDPYKRSAQEIKMEAVGKIVNDLSFIDGYNEDERKHLINEAQRTDLTYDQWNEDKLIMGGNHPLQGGFQTYYIGDDGRPKVVPYGQKAPNGKNIASIWGSQEEADDDNVFTTVAKYASQIPVGFVEGAWSLPATAYGLATGKDAQWYDDLKNWTATLAPSISSAAEEKFYKGKVDSISDVANLDNWNFTADNVAGGIGELVKSAGEYMLGGAFFKGLGVGAKSISAVESAVANKEKVGYGLKLASKLPYLLTGVAVKLGEGLEAADEAGVKDRAKFAMASIYASAASMIETTMGLEAKLLANPALQAKKSAMTKALIKNFVKDSKGQITKESLDELHKLTTVATVSFLKRYGKEATTTALGEGTEEVLQNATHKGMQQIYDNLYAENKEIGKGRYGKEIANPEALAEYINDIVAGAIGGGAGSVGVDKYRRMKADKQSQNAYEYIKKGPAGVTALKAQLAGSLKAGSITKEEYDLGVNKIDTYNKYFEQTKDLSLDDESNRRVFDLTWSNENLKQQQEELNQNPESKIKGTIPHRRLLDTEALLEANSKEMSELMAKNIADQQTAIAVKSEQKLAETKSSINKPTGKPLEAKPETASASLISQIKSAENEKDVDALFKEADEKGVTSPDLIDAVSKRREEIQKIKSLPAETQGFIEATYTKHPQKNWNNLLDVSNSEKSDTVVDYLIEKGSKFLKNGTLELGAFADKIVNGKKLPLYYDVDFGGKRIKIASSDYTKFIKEKNLVGKKVDVQLILPTDENLEELSKEGVLDQYDVVERTGKDGVKAKYFVFKEDDQKQRYPYVLVARLQTKSGNTGAKVGNLATGDYSVVSNKREGREGLRRPKKENAQKPNDVEFNVPGQVTGAVNFDETTAQIDYEAQLKAANKVEVDEDEGVTTFKQENQSERNKSTPVDVKPIPKPAPKNKEEYVASKIEALKNDEESDYNEESLPIYERIFAAEYDLLNNYKLYENDTENENAIKGLSTTDNSKSEPIVKDIESKGAAAKRAGTKREIRREIEKVDNVVKKIKKKVGSGLNFAFAKAMKHDVTSAYDQVLQYFIGGGKINAAAIQELFGGVGKEKAVKSESDLRKGYLDSSPLKRKTDVAIDGLANYMWQQQKVDGQYDAQDFVEAISSVVMDYSTRADMAKHLNDVFSVKDQVFDAEQPTENIDEEGEVKDASGENNLEDEGLGIADYNGEPQFQKVKTLAAIEIEKEIVKAEAEFKAAKSAFDKKRKELDTAIVEDNSDLFGERKSSASQGLFDERIDVGARDKAIEPFKVRLEKATKALSVLNNKLDAEEGKQDLTLFQRGSSLTTESKADRDKKIELLKKAIPSLTVIEDETIGDNVAGQLDADGKTVRLNPRYNFLDTPIHEFGHALIDMMGGVNNPIIKRGVEQLKETKLWKDTEAKYPELSEDMLAKEVLAEAIGREGAKLFDDKAKQSKFESWLSGLFYKLKSLLGIDKNVAKKLASQLLSGKRIKGETVSSIKQSQKTESDELISYRNIQKSINAISDIENNDVVKSLNEFVSSITGESDNRRGVSKYYDTGKTVGGKRLIIRVSNHSLNDSNIGENEYVISLIVSDELSTKVNPFGGNVKTEIQDNYASIEIPDSGKNLDQYLEEVADEINSLYSDNNKELIQKQKVGEAKAIKEAKPLSYNKWMKEQDFDELSIKEAIADLKEDIADATTEQEKEELRKKLEILEDSINNKRVEHEQYVYDFNAIVDFVKSQGDVSNLSLDELNEMRSQMIKYDDLVKSKLYKDLLYNIGVKVNEIQSDELKSANPDYDPEQEQQGDLTKTDVWAQGLSTIGEKFPAIQYFYKKYRKASGDMSRELSQIQQRGQELAEKVIKEYQSKSGLTGSVKNLLLGAGDKIFAFMANDGKLIEKGTPEYNKLSTAQKQLLDFVTEQKKALDPYMEGEGSVLLKSGAGFIESFQKSGIYKAYANYITKNHNIRNAVVSFKNPETGKVSDMSFGDVEVELQKFGKQSRIKNVQAMALLTKYNIQARNKLATKRGSKGKYFLAPDGTLISMFGGEFKGDFTTNYYETFMKYAQDAVFSKNMSPLMPVLTGVEMFYKSMGSDKENVSKFLDVVKKGKFLGETIESGLGEKADLVLRLLRKWTSWRFIAFNIPANVWNVAVGEYNQFRADGGKQYAKGKQRFFGSMIKGRKNAKAYNILKKYNPELVTDINRIDPEKHVGKFFDMLAFGGQKLGESIIRGSSIIGKLSTEHYNWFDNKGNIKGTASQVAEREVIIKEEIAKYIAEVERTQGRYSDVEKRNFAYFELGQFFGQFKVWMPEWLSDRFARTYIDADGVKRKGSFNTLWTYGMRDFLRDATKKDFYTSDDPKHVAARKQLRGMIITATLLLSYLSVSDDDEDKDLANTLDKGLRNISSIYRMDNNTFLISQPAAAMSVVVDLSKTLNAAIQGQVIKSGKNKGDIKALNLAYNLIPANKLISGAEEILTDDE